MLLQGWKGSAGLLPVDKSGSSVGDRLSHRTMQFFSGPALRYALERVVVKAEHKMAVSLMPSAAVVWVDGVGLLGLSDPGRVVNDVGLIGAQSTTVQRMSLDRLVVEATEAGQV